MFINNVVQALAATCLVFVLSVISADSQSVSSTEKLDGGKQKAICFENGTRQSLNILFDVVFQNNQPAVKDFFGRGDFVLDSDIFQFPSSDFAYGKIAVSKQHYESYLLGEALNGLKIMKLTFTIGDRCLPILSDIFLYSKKGENEYNFSSYEADGIVPRDECLECHEGFDNNLFYKWNFYGRIE